MIGYWFSKGDTLSHGDGRKIVVGETLSVEGPLRMCHNGLHWCEHPFDALMNAPGPWMHKVRAGGETIRFADSHDKYCSRERTVLARINATQMLYLYIRSEALSVADEWDMPSVVRRYLETGEEVVREAARYAAWNRIGQLWSNRPVIAAGIAAWSASDKPWMGAMHLTEPARERFRAAVEAAFGDGP